MSYIKNVLVAFLFTGAFAVFMFIGTQFEASKMFCELTSMVGIISLFIALGKSLGWWGN